MARAIVGEDHHVLDAHADFSGNVDAGSTLKAMPRSRTWCSLRMYGSSWMATPMPWPVRLIKYSPKPALA
jgi:hypothetical protein